MRNEVLLFNITMGMRERDIKTKEDVVYPYKVIHRSTGLLIETLTQPPMF
jgi:hypothetical protein